MHYREIFKGKWVIKRKDFGEFCVGCTKCFTESETKCPHYEKLKPLPDAMDEANVIILASPVYVYHATGAMKAFLDHYGYRWMVHSPEKSMFKKKRIIDRTTSSIAKKIIRNSGNVKPGLKTKGMFWIMHLMQKNGFNPRDVEHWKSKDWTEKTDLGNKFSVL